MKEVQDRTWSSWLKDKIVLSVHHMETIPIPLTDVLKLVSFYTSPLSVRYFIGDEWTTNKNKTVCGSLSNKSNPYVENSEENFCKEVC